MCRYLASIYGKFTKWDRTNYLFNYDKLKPPLPLTYLYYRACIPMWVCSGFVWYNNYILVLTMYLYYIILFLFLFNIQRLCLKNRCNYGGGVLYSIIIKCNILQPYSFYFCSTFKDYAWKIDATMGEGCCIELSSNATYYMQYYYENSLWLI